MYKNIFKRPMEFCIALMVFVIIWPVLLGITIWFHFINKGAGAFFLQERPGKDGKVFKVIKFKTMTDERDANGNLLSDKERLTKAVSSSSSTLQASSNSRAYSTAIGASYNFDKRVTNVVLPTEAGPTTNMIVVNSRRND